MALTFFSAIPEKDYRPLVALFGNTGQTIQSGPLVRMPSAVIIAILGLSDRDQGRRERRCTALTQKGEYMSDSRKHEPFYQGS